MPTINGNAGYRGRSARSRLVVDARARDTQTNRSNGAYAQAGRGAGSAQGPGGISAHVANQATTYGTIGGGAGSSMMNEQGVSVYVMSTLRGRTFDRPNPFSSYGQWAGASGESLEAFYETQDARRAIAMQAIAPALENNPELHLRSGLQRKSWFSPRRNAAMAEGRNMSGNVPIADQVVVIEHPALQGAKAILGPRSRKHHNDDDGWPAIIVDLAFLRALEARGSRLEDTDKQLLTSGQFNGAQIDVPDGNAFLLKDGRRAQQFGSAVIVLDKKEGEPAQIWKRERLVEEGLLDADKAPPPLYPEGTFGRPGRRRASPTSTLIAERARASASTIEEVEVSDAARAAWLPPSTLGDGTGPLRGLALQRCAAFSRAVLRGYGPNKRPVGGHQLIPLQRGRTFGVGEWIGKRFDAIFLPKDPMTEPGRNGGWNRGHEQLRDSYGRLEELLPSEGTVLALHHAVHGHRTLHGPAAEAFVCRPEELKGWAVGELLGAPTGDWGEHEKLGARPFDKGSFSFEHGTLTNTREGVEIKWHKDLDELVGAGKRLPSTKVAARELLKHYTSTAEASDLSGSEGTIGLGDLITVSVDPARPAALRKAAEVMINNVTTGLPGLAQDTPLDKERLTTFAA